MSFGDTQDVFSPPGFKIFYFSQFLFKKYVIPQPLFSCAWKFSFYFQWVLAELWLVWQVVGSGSDRSRRLKQVSSSARSQPTVGEGTGKPSPCSGPAGKRVWGSPLPPLLWPGEVSGCQGRHVLVSTAIASCVCWTCTERAPCPLFCIFSSAEEVESLTQGAVGGQERADKDRAALLSQICGFWRPS